MDKLTPIIGHTGWFNNLSWHIQANSPDNPLSHWSRTFPFVLHIDPNVWLGMELDQSGPALEESGGKRRK